MNNEERQEKVVAVINRKGGVGKSTITAHLATCISKHTESKGIKVAVLDADDQNSLMGLREKENNLIKQKDEEYLKLAYKRGVTKFEIQTSKPEDIVANIKEMKKENDILFVDFPGSFMEKNIVESLMHIEYFIIPIYPEEFEVSSSIKFIKKHIEFLKNSSHSAFKKHTVVMNRYTDAEEQKKKNPYVELEKELQINDIPYLKHKIYQRKDFQDSKSTYMPQPIKQEDPASFYRNVGDVLRFLEIL